MIILSLIGLAAGGYCFYMVTRIPLALYQKLDIEVQHQSAAATCLACERAWTGLSVIDKNFSHNQSMVRKILVDEVSQWQTCKECDGTGVVGHRENFQRQDGDGFFEDSRVVESGCGHCNGAGGWDEVVEQVFDDEEYEQPMYRFTIHCDRCKSDYDIVDEKEPQLPRRTPVSIKNRINQGLVKGVVTGVLLGVLVAIYWSLTSLPDRLFGDDPATLDGYIGGIAVFFFASTLLALPGIVIGVLWGAVVTLLSRPLEQLLDPSSYKFSLVMGGLSLVVLLLLVDILFPNFLHIGGRDADMMDQLVAYAILFSFGALTFAAGRFVYSLVEKRAY